MASQNVNMIQLMNSPEAQTFGAVIGNLAAAARMPGISYHPSFVDGGGLMTYGPNPEISGQRHADQVALILKGAKPGDLPVIEPDTYDFLVNLKAAKDLGLELPQSIIASATELRD
jgi:putative ABC transport system substrate-binding protein